MGGSKANEMAKERNEVVKAYITICKIRMIFSEEMRSLKGDVPEESV